jgi:N-acetyl-gamma-glutamyl-phosphate reductase
VANPGCFPTAALLAVAPLVRAGLIEPRGIIVDAKSGVTGAGRQAKEEYSFGEIDEDTRAYRLLAHQHTPEMARHIARAASRATADIGLTFTAHLLPVKRGILATCYGMPTKKGDPKLFVECMEAAYRNSTFVEVVPPAQVTLTSVVGTNRARVGVIANDDVVIAVASIDNLLKGASGQAVQTLNRMFGLEEGAGLTSLHRSAP